MSDDTDLRVQVHAMLTREEFLGAKDCEPRDFESKIWGGFVRYRPATVGDKSTARRRATIPAADGKKTDVDYDLFAAHLLVQCIVEPKLSEADIDALTKRNASEVERLFKAITEGISENPR